MAHDANESDATGVFVQARHPEAELAVVFEDDGRTAYGYLLRDSKIVADVWIYNRGPAPEQPEWTDRERAPFRNPHLLEKWNAMRSSQYHHLSLLARNIYK